MTLPQTEPVDDLLQDFQLRLTDCMVLGDHSSGQHFHEVHIMVAASGSIHVRLALNWTNNLMEKNPSGDSCLILLIHHTVIRTNNM